MNTKQTLARALARRHSDPRDWPSYRALARSKRHRGSLRRGIYGIPSSRLLDLLGLPVISGGAEGRLGHIGVAKEMTFGTAVAAARYFQFISESLYSDVGVVTPTNIVGVFDEGPTYLGLREHKGKIRFNVFPDFIGLLLSAAWGADLGPVTTTGGALTAATTGGSLATGTVYVRVSPIYGSNVVATTGAYSGVLGPASTEQSVPVTGPTASVGVAAPTLSAGAPAPAGYLINYGTAVGNETVYIVTPTTTGTIATITTMTLGAGAISGSPVSGINTHVFDPRQANWGTNSVVQPLTFEIHRDLGQAFQFAGTAIEKLMLAFGVKGGAGGDEVLTAELDVIAKTYALITATTPVFDNLTPFLWNQAKIALAGTSYVTSQDIKFDIDNGIVGKPYIDGTNEVHSIVAKSPRLVTISGTVLADLTQWQNFINRVQSDINILFTGPVLGTNGAFSLGLDAPLFQYTAYPIGIAGPYEILVTFTGKAKYNFGAVTQPAPGSPMRIALANDVVTAY